MLPSPLFAVAVATDVVVSAVVPAVAVHSRAETQLLVVAGEPGPVETEIFISMEDKGRWGSMANSNRCHDNRYQAQYS